MSFLPEETYDLEQALRFPSENEEFEISVKLDTNGSMPGIIERVLEGLADHVAMDKIAHRSLLSKKSYGE